VPFLIDLNGFKIDQIYIIIYRFDIVYKRQLTLKDAPKNIKKHQKALADENLTN